MAAVNLLVADCAVLISRGTQVVKRRRHYAHGRTAGDGGGKISVTLQADLLHYRPRQHPRIGRSVRLVASCTTLETYRRVLKSEWTALIPMAFETARIVGGKTLGHRAAGASVRVVAIDARHRSFRHAMVKRLLKLSHYICVAGGALLIDGRGLACHQPKRTVGVNFMTRGT